MALQNSQKNSNLYNKAKNKKKKKKKKKNVGQFVKKGYARKELLNTIKEIYRGRQIGRKGVFRILLNL